MYGIIVSVATQEIFYGMDYQCFMKKLELDTDIFASYQMTELDDEGEWIESCIGYRHAYPDFPMTCLIPKVLA